MTAPSNISAWSARQIQEHFEQNAFYTVEQGVWMSQLFEHIVQSSMYMGNGSVLLEFIKGNPWSFWGKFERSDHVTVSVLLLDVHDEKVLLTHHKKLRMWLQLGGHWSDEQHEEQQIVSCMPLVGALKEMYEEGFNRFNVPEEQLIRSQEHQVLIDGSILDVDVHNVGDHKHYDVCYLVRWISNQPHIKTDESSDLRWMSLDEVLQISTDKEEALSTQGCTDERLHRMIRKVQALKEQQLLEPKEDWK